MYHLEANNGSTNAVEVSRADPRAGSTVSSNPRLAIRLEAGSDPPNPKVSVGPM